MVADVFDRMSPLTVASIGEDVMTMGQLEEEESHGMPALVSPPASPTTTKPQVQPSMALMEQPPIRKKRAYRKRKPSTNTAKRQLALDFEPSSYSVICGRGQECFDSKCDCFFKMVSCATFAVY